ncbi:MAG: FAD-dependent oxidoreductase [Myxococcaceae bacterium]
MSFSRRSMLLAGAGLALRAWADDPRLGAEVLAAPDFTKLRETNPYVIGVRPHRKGGVRVELDQAFLEVSGGKKYVIHNYGHGGAGITLSFGTASVTADLVEEVVKKNDLLPQFAVIGTGVAGLTTALELHRRFPKRPITVYAKDLDVKNTTSFIAGGQFEPSGIWHEYDGGDDRKKILGGYLRRARERIVQLAGTDLGKSYGIETHRNFTLDHENKALDEFTPFDVVPPAKRGRLPFEKLDVEGKEYANWLLNPTMLLPGIRATLDAAKVPFVARTFATQGELVVMKENVIVNCTGYGAKKFFDDDDVVPQRGHLVVLQKTDPKQSWFFSGGCLNNTVAYAFCRQNDIVLGGTVISGKDSLEHTKKDDAVFKQIVANLQHVFEGNVSDCKPG